MFYDLKAIYNPFDEDFKVNVSSPAINIGEEYTIEAKGLLVLPEKVAYIVVTQLSREILKRKGKEFDDPERSKIEEDLLSHKFEIKEVSSEAPISAGGKKKK